LGALTFVSTSWIKEKDDPQHDRDENLERMFVPLLRSVAPKGLKGAQVPTLSGNRLLLKMPQGLFKVREGPALRKATAPEVRDMGVTNLRAKPPREERTNHLREAITAKAFTRVESGTTIAGYRHTSVAQHGN